MHSSQEQFFSLRVTTLSEINLIDCKNKSYERLWGAGVHLKSNKLVKDLEHKPYEDQLREL